MTKVGVLWDGTSNSALTRIATSDITGWNTMTQAQATAALNAVSPWQYIQRVSLLPRGVVRNRCGGACYDDTDGSSLQNKMVYIPAFYSYYDVATTHAPQIAHWISNTLGDVITKIDGGTHTIVAGDLNPAFIVDAVPRSEIFYGAFEGTAIASGATTYMRSLATGALPTIGNSVATDRASANALGPGWGLINAQAHSAVTSLITVEFASYFLANALGFGPSMGPVVTGQTAANGNTSVGDTGGMISPVSWRGIEEVWGGVYQYLDGILPTGTGPYPMKLLVQTANQAKYGDVTKYVSAGTSYPAAGGEPISAVAMPTSYRWLFEPTAIAASGDTSNYYCGELYLDEATGVYVGGPAGYAAGPWNRLLSNVESGSDNRGVRLLYVRAP